ncbi:hypothetical protein [Paenibacillus sp. GbtcB18]|uniref:hypothetical protein n=1 Tax=Paenibacillus sp. GbtcB18 TaxID=2824763 RepID=UPI001C301592|nr:hypothetical protein [Paenibacillus sp. GbtcB18]
MEMIENQKTRYEYTNNISLEDMRVLNVMPQFKPIRRYDEAKSTILSYLDSGITVFIRASEYHIPHRDSYLLKHTNHSYMLSGYEISCSGDLIYHTRDNVGIAIIERNYEERIVKAAYDDCTTPNYICTLAYGDKTVSNDLLQWLKDASQTYLHSHVDSLQLFAAMVQRLKDEPSDLVSVTDNMAHALAIISGSRYAFLQYLARIEHKNPDLSACLENSYKLASGLMFMAYKTKISGTINKERFELQCDELRETEQKIYLQIKQIEF